MRAVINKAANACRDMYMCKEGVRTITDRSLSSSYMVSHAIICTFVDKDAVATTAAPCYAMRRDPSASRIAKD